MILPTASPGLNPFVLLPTSLSPLIYDLTAPAKTITLKLSTQGLARHRKSDRRSRHTSHTFCLSYDHKAIDASISKTFRFPRGKVHWFAQDNIIFASIRRKWGVETPSWPSNCMSLSRAHILTGMWITFYPGFHSSSPYSVSTWAVYKNLQQQTGGSSPHPLDCYSPLLSTDTLSHEVLG